ncbi:MAG: nucleotidyltransferase [Sedimentisphaerales bacterium]|nr:nucleotidyltransferase [Sedimentisphaerales bacterium]
MYYFELLESLHKHEVRYLIVGGLAVNLHGVPRMTQDVDLIIEMSRENIAGTIKSFYDIGYLCKLPVDPADMAKPEIVEQWVTQRNLIALSFFDTKKPFKVVDVILQCPLNFERAYANKLVKMVNSVPVNVVSVADLITMKSYANRQQDISDIELLKKVEKLGGSAHGQ